MIHPRHVIVGLCCIALLSVGCQSEPVSVDYMHEVRVGYAEALSTYSPLSYEAKNRRILANVYEPLVRYDGTFNHETALAVSWGRLDDNTWDFRLREGVLFHDGRSFDAQDAVHSLDLARQPDSELTSLLSGIESIQATGDHRFEIETESPDPLLLNKLTTVFMVPDGEEEFEVPVGTGPYRLSGFADDTLQLERFEEYWGALPYFERADLVFLGDPDERFGRFLSGELHFLANVPPQYVDEIEGEDLDIKHFPNLEVSFLMLNTQGPFADESLRAAVWKALSTDYGETFGGGFLRPIDQFAATGITGYVSGVEAREQELEEALELRERYAENLSLTLDIPVGLEALGDAISEDLAQIDIEVTVNAMEAAAFETHVLSGASDFYFFGWHYDVADVADFYESVVHAPEGAYGHFNGIGYENAQVDAWIEEAAQLLDVEGRRAILDDIAGQLLEDQVIVPLFEAQVLYALRPEIHWAVRLDGQVLASEIVENMVK